MRSLLLAAALTFVALGCAKDKDSGAAAATKDDVATMSVDEVERGLNANELVAVDCNGAVTRKKHGVVPGAILVVDEEAYEASVLPPDKATKLVFYCSNAS